MMDETQTMDRPVIYYLDDNHLRRLLAERNNDADLPPALYLPVGMGWLVGEKGK